MVNPNDFTGLPIGAQLILALVSDFKAGFVWKGYDCEEL